MEVVITAPNRKVVVTGPDTNGVVLQPAIAQRTIQISNKKTIIGNPTSKLVTVGQRQPVMVIANRGPRGIQGIQGVQGIQGIQGNQGIQGVPGPPGPSGNLITANAGATISAFKMVVLINDQLFLADATNPAHAGQVIGIALQSATIGNPVDVQPDGIATGGVGFSAGAIYFLGTSGNLVTSVPGGAVFRQIVAIGQSSSILLIDLRPVILL